MEDMSLARHGLSRGAIIALMAPAYPAQNELN
jgi:hypothetical protein